MNTLIELLETHNMSNKQTYIKTILLSQRLQSMITQLKCQQVTDELISPTETVVAFPPLIKKEEKPLPSNPPSLYLMSFDSAIDIGPVVLRNKPLPTIQPHHTIIHVKRVTYLTKILHRSVN